MDSAIINYYNSYDEEGRLFRNNTHNIEWITTMHYFKRLIPTNSYIFDGCAGTGNYAFELASLGHKVEASDIVPHNVDIMKQKQNDNSKLADIYVGDICNLSFHIKEKFDVVLCMGAFYHIDVKARNRAMQECLRVLKKGGLLIISYINNMAVISNSITDDLSNIDVVLSNYKAKTIDGIFLHMTPNEIENMALENKTTILKHIATDGLCYFNTSKINGSSDENFRKYVKLHLETCEDKSLLGYSLHGLIFLQK